MIVYGGTFLLLVNSSCPSPIKIMVSGLLFWALSHIMRDPRPQPSRLTLRYNYPIWFLQENRNPEIPYESLRILIDTDLFFLMRLWEGSKQRLLVIFHDQLSEEDHHLFRVLEKIN